MLLFQYFSKYVPNVKLDYVIIKKGNIPVLLTSPHGGKLALPGVKIRNSPGCCLISDSNTNMVVDRVVENLNDNHSGKIPYVVQALAKRKYCDLNRPAEKAYDQEEAKDYYDEYHNAISEAIIEMKNKFPNKLPILLDIHGQIEKVDDILRGTSNGKTYPFLFKKYGFESMIGKKSILGVLESSGISVFPSCSIPSQTGELKGYTGGWTVCYYSGIHPEKKFDNPIDSLQLEIGRSYRRPKTMLQKLEKFSFHLAEAINIFTNEYNQ